MTCDEEGRTGSRALAGEGVAASAACSWASRWGPGGPVCAWEGERGEGEPKDTKVAAMAIYLGGGGGGYCGSIRREGGAPGVGFLCGEVGGEGGREDAEGLLHWRRGAPDGRRWRGGRLHGGGACAKVERCGKGSAQGSIMAL
jgi:hypothetical protein